MTAKIENEIEVTPQVTGVLLSSGEAPAVKYDYSGSSADMYNTTRSYQNIFSESLRSQRTIIPANKRVSVSICDHTIDMLLSLLQSDIHVAIET